MSKYYKIKYSLGYTDFCIIKARNPRSAIKKFLRQQGIDWLNRINIDNIYSVEEINYFKCLEVTNNE